MAFIVIPCRIGLRGPAIELVIAEEEMATMTPGKRFLRGQIGAYTVHARHDSYELTEPVSNLVWMIVLAAVVLVYKVAPAPAPRSMLALSAALVALGVLYAVAG